MRQPPSFPQTLAEETLEIWLSQSCTLSSGRKRHICVAITSQSPNLASLSAAPPQQVWRHEPVDAASSKALGTWQPNCSQFHEVQVNSGASPKGLQLQLSAV